MLFILIESVLLMIFIDTVAFKVEHSLMREIDNIKSWQQQLARCGWGSGMGMHGLARLPR